MSPWSGGEHQDRVVEQAGLAELADQQADLVVDVRALRVEAHARRAGLVAVQAVVAPAAVQLQGVGGSASKSRRPFADDRLVHAEVLVVAGDSRPAA